MLCLGQEDRGFAGRMEERMKALGYSAVIDAPRDFTSTPLPDEMGANSSSA
jgi:hypothetical protein